MLLELTSHRRVQPIDPDDVHRRGRRRSGELLRLWPGNSRHISVPRDHFSAWRRYTSRPLGALLLMNDNPTDVIDAKAMMCMHGRREAGKTLPGHRHAPPAPPGYGVSGVVPVIQGIVSVVAVILGDWAGGRDIGHAAFQYSLSA